MVNSVLGSARDELHGENDFAGLRSCSGLCAKITLHYARLFRVLDRPLVQHLVRAGHYFRLDQLVIGRNDSVDDHHLPRGPGLSDSEPSLLHTVIGGAVNWPTPKGLSPDGWKILLSLGGASPTLSVLASMIVFPRSVIVNPLGMICSWKCRALP